MQSRLFKSPFGKKSNPDNYNVEYNSFVRVSDGFIKSFNQFVSRKCGVDNRAVVAAYLLSIVDNQIRFQHRENHSAIISREDFLERGLEGKTLTFCINKLKAMGVIDTSRKLEVDGVNVYFINYEKLEEYEKEGNTQYKESLAESKEKRKETKEKSIEKIKSNLESHSWTKEQVNNINKMAYDESTEEDVYNTGLTFYERTFIQLISKAYKLYSGKQICWTHALFNGARMHCMGISKKKFTGTQEEYESLFYQLCKPQKLIDAIKLLSSKHFEKLTNCNSNVFWHRLNAAMQYVSSQKVTDILYGKYTFRGRYYEGDRGTVCEDVKYYRYKVDPNANIRIKGNPIDRYYNNIVA